MTRRRQQLGATGERRARQYLESLGFGFVAANFRTRLGELDLVMRDGETLVAVEVKTRRQEASELLSARQLARISRAIVLYAAERDHEDVRVDLVAVQGREIEHFPDIAQSDRLLA